MVALKLMLESCVIARFSLDGVKEDVQPGLGGGWGGCWVVPAAYSSKNNHIGNKFDWVVENPEEINLMLFNWHVTLFLRHNDVQLLNFEFFTKFS